MYDKKITFGSEYNGPKILISIPTMGRICKYVTQWLIATLLYENHLLRCHGEVIMPTDRPYEQNLHKIIYNLNVNGQYDFWINIDDDNPPVKNIIDLIFLDKDMIGCPTPVWKYEPGKAERPIMWNAYDYEQSQDAYREHECKEGLQQVDAVGTGCFILAQRCFSHHALRQGAFTRKLDKHGLVYKGNDISFCERLLAADFSIFAHFGYPCHHFNNIDLLDVASSIGEMFKDSDA